MDNLAKIRKRVLASFIDYVLILVATFTYIMIFGEPNAEGGQSVEGLAALPMFLMWFIYFPIIEGATSQTLGKKLLKLRVVKKNGDDVSLGSAFLRHLCDPIDLGFGGLVAILVMRNSDKKQRVGDLVANTVVVEDKFATCENCDTELSLSRHELILGQYTCPKCGHINKLANAGGLRHMPLQNDIV